MGKDPAKIAAAVGCAASHESPFRRCCCCLTQHYGLTTRCLQGSGCLVSSLLRTRGAEVTRRGASAAQVVRMPIMLAVAAHHVVLLFGNGRSRSADRSVAALLVISKMEIIW
jgi:hypothetical protein